jgi:hypothetical protein
MSSPIPEMVEQPLLRKERETPNRGATIVAWLSVVMIFGLLSSVTTIFRYDSTSSSSLGVFLPAVGPTSLVSAFPSRMFTTVPDGQDAKDGALGRSQQVPGDSLGKLGQGVSTDPNSRRSVTFNVDVGCPPTWWRTENQAFWDAGIARVQLVLRFAQQPPPFEFNRQLPGGEGLWEELARVGDSKIFTGTKEIDNTCEYGFVLINSLGEERWEIGGSNVRPALMDAECSSKFPAGGNIYHNRLMSNDPANSTIDTIFGGCQAECPIKCKIIALSNEPGDNVYTVLERDRDEAWNKVQGHMVDVAAGFDDLWAIDGAGAVQYTHISSLNASASGWNSQTLPAMSPGVTARTMDVGVEEVYLIATDGNYWKKPADGSGAWQHLPGAIKQAGVGHISMWTVALNRPSLVGATRLPSNGHGVIFNLPGTSLPRQCEVGLEFAYCTNELNEVYKAKADFEMNDPSTGQPWAYPTVPPPDQYWTKLDGIAAKQVTVGEENLWAIDATGGVKFCALPCNTPNWVQPTGVPTGIIYIDASKYK